MVLGLLILPQMVNVILSIAPFMEQFVVGKTSLALSVEVFIECCIFRPHLMYEYFSVFNQRSLLAALHQNLHKTRRFSAESGNNTPIN